MFLQRVHGSVAAAAAVESAAGPAGRTVSTRHHTQYTYRLDHQSMCLFHAFYMASPPALLSAAPGAAPEAKTAIEPDGVDFSGFRLPSASTSGVG